MTPSERQAESRKYSNAVVLVLPLDNGEFAVYNNARELSEIVPAAELLTALARVKPVSPLQVAAKPPAPAKPIPVSLATLIANARKK